MIMTNAQALDTSAAVLTSRLVCRDLSLFLHEDGMVRTSWQVDWE